MNTCTILHENFLLLGCNIFCEIFLKSHIHMVQGPDIEGGCKLYGLDVVFSTVKYDTVSCLFVTGF